MNRSDDRESVFVELGHESAVESSSVQIPTDGIAHERSSARSFLLIGGPSGEGIWLIRDRAVEEHRIGAHGETGMEKMA